MRPITALVLSIAISLGAVDSAFCELRAEAPAPEDAVSTGGKIVFKQESTQIGTKAYLIFGLLAAFAGLSGLVVFMKSRSSVSAQTNKRIRIVEKSVLSHGLLAIVVDVQNESFLVIQDKSRHTVTRLNVAHNDQ